MNTHSFPDPSRFVRVAALVLAVSAMHVTAQVPQLINYQGRVAVGGVNFDGAGSFKFALVNTDGTTTYWSNDGTSTVGDEPAAAVPLSVARGLYSVLLGDDSLANMTAVPASVFANPDVRLRVWFDDGVNGSQLLAPDQRVSAVGYAMMAGDVADGAITSTKIAAGAVTSDHIALGAITGDRLAAGTLDASLLLAAAPPEAGQALTFDGAGFLWAAGGAGGGAFSLNGSSAFYNGGNVGIGTANPQTSLDIISPSHPLSMTANGPDVTFKDTAHGNARGVIQSVNGEMNFFAESYLNGSNPFALLTLKNNGRVGIGSPQPAATLDVVSDGNALLLTGFAPFLTLQDTNAGYARVRIQDANGEMNFFAESYMNGSNLGAYFKLFSNGNVSVASLTIRGGADLAEPFAMSQRGVPHGAVVVIDAEHPGKLRMSDRASDKRVAGIVSGANGINPGISMLQENALEAGENVALSGRVYVNANTTGGAIEPGDLLTTSDVPGEAMKTASHDAAQGAIIGKAMTRLDAGSGSVLVLVTLQ